jgi:hypothetical protein
MRTIGFTTSQRAFIALSALSLSFATPSFLWAQGTLENPQTGSAQSGLGVLSGWVCNANNLQRISLG